MKKKMKTFNNFCIKQDFKENTKVVYDDHTKTPLVIWQPYVYEIGKYLAKENNCEIIVDIGCGLAEKLMPSEFNIIGIDYGKNIKNCRDIYDSGEWLEQDLEEEFILDTSKKSIIICADVIEHLLNPGPLLHSIKNINNTAILISTPNRSYNYNFPSHRHHIREWHITELEEYLSKYFKLDWLGITQSNSNKNSDWNTTLAIVAPDIELEVPEKWGRIK